MPEDRPTVGVVGLGAIGSGAATSLAAAGLPLVVCDVRPEATGAFADRAEVAATPAALAAGCDVVLIAVVDDAQVLEVLDGPDGVLATAGAGTAVVVVSTISPACIAAVGGRSGAAGVAVVDCGVSGGPAAAASGDLVCMVGGDPAVVARLAPVFEAIGSLTVTMGPFGTGMAAKLARNLIQYGGWLAAYEGQRLAESSGVELARLAQVVRESDKRIGGAATLMFRATVAPFTDADDAGLVGAMRSAATLAHKDLQAALALADSLGVDLPLAAMADARCDDVFGVGGGR